MTVLYSAFVGFLAGILAALYRLCIVKIDALRIFIVSNHWFILWMILTIPTAIVLKIIATRASFVSGSGIPQVKALISRKIDYDPLKVLFYKFVGGIFAIFNGFSLGREGPSIQIGSSVGYWFYKHSNGKSDREQLITISAGAGLAAAFNAPLAAIAFSIEELQMSVSVLSVVNCAVAAISADFASKMIFGMTPVFFVQLKDVLPLKYYSLIIVLGIIVGISGSLFERLLLYFVDVFKNFRWLNILIPTALAWVFMIFLPQILGGGHELVIHSLSGLFSLKTILILLIAKFFFTLISYGSKAPGGIFLPMVAIGAMTGVFYSKMIAMVSSIGDFYLPNFVILGIAGYLTAVVRAPLTSIILTAELVGSFDHFLSLLLVSVVAYVVSGFLNTQPIYDVLFKKIVHGVENGYKKKGEDTDLA